MPVCSSDHNTLDPGTCDNIFKSVIFKRILLIHILSMLSNSYENATEPFNSLRPSDAYMRQ